LLAVLTGPLRQQDLSDASTLFSVWQRIAGSLGVGLIASVFARQAAARGPVTALHTAGVMMAAVAALGLLAATMLPRRPNAVTSGSTAAGGLATEGRARRAP
jgi:hypothetical protein